MKNNPKETKLAKLWEEANKPKPPKLTWYEKFIEFIGTLF